MWGRGGELDLSELWARQELNPGEPPLKAAAAQDQNEASCKSVCLRRFLTWVWPAGATQPVQTRVAEASATCGGTAMLVSFISKWMVAASSRSLCNLYL